MPDENLTPAAPGQLALDVVETADALVVLAPIAGVDEDSVEVTLDAETLTIRGRRARPDLPGLERIFAAECFWGDFSRAILLPQTVDPEGIEAKFSAGILTVKIPKVPSARGARRIQIGKN